MGFLFFRFFHRELVIVMVFVVCCGGVLVRCWAGAHGVVPCCDCAAVVLVLVL